MAKFYAAPVAEVTTATTKADSMRAAGELRVYESVHTATGTEAATGDVIVIAELPVGAEVLPEECAVAQEASMGGSAIAIAKIGDSGDDDRYTATSITIHSSNAGVTAVTPAVATSVIPRYKVTEATRQVVASITRTNAITAGKKILFRTVYRI